MSDNNLLIRVDLSKQGEEYQKKKYMEQLWRELRLGIFQEKYGYEKYKKAEIGKSNQGAYAVIPEFGEKVASYDMRTYMRWCQEDPDFWKDASNRNKFKKDNPEVICTKH